VYYSTANVTIGNPQLGLVQYPITASSALVTSLNGSVANGLDSSLNIVFDASGRLFVVNGGSPFTISVLTPPLGSSSAASFILTMPAGTGCLYGIGFDASGNLWASDPCKNKIYEFDGPFSAPSTLTAHVTLSSPSSPEGIAFDSSGNLWVALNQPTGGIAEFLKGSGFTSATPVDHTLNGVDDPMSVAFDKFGNLYSSGRLPAEGIAMWNLGNLGAGATPNIFNPTSLLAGFLTAQLAFDMFGNLYAADCGATAKIYVYPSATTPFSATLAPIIYTDANILSLNCVKGIAVH
jgi:DNA-binding beta-propeller fold protein YncE